MLSFLRLRPGIGQLLCESVSDHCVDLSGRSSYLMFYALKFPQQTIVEIFLKIVNISWIRLYPAVDQLNYKVCATVTANT